MIPPRITWSPMETSIPTQRPLPPTGSSSPLDDATYGTTGLNPVSCSRKTKLSGAAQFNWDTQANDWHYDYAFEHTIYLRLPYSLGQSKNYTLEIQPAINSDVTNRSFTFDIFNSRSEAVHVNLVGYLNDSSIKAAELHLWMGDGGARNYAGFVGNNVYIYNVDNAATEQVGTVALWKNSATESNGRNLTGSAVWSADFTGFSKPGTYRVAIDGVGCSEDFQIRHDLYFEPFRISTLRLLLHAHRRGYEHVAGSTAAALYPEPRPCQLQSVHHRHAALEPELEQHELGQSQRLGALCQSGQPSKHERLGRPFRCLGLGSAFGARFDYLRHAAAVCHDRRRAA